MEMVERFFPGGPLCIAADEAFVPLAWHIAGKRPQTQLRLLRQDTLRTALEVPPGTRALLLATPETFTRLHLHERLDFSRGEPRLPGIESKVWIFPVESLMRILSRMPESEAAKARLTEALQPNRKYRITAPGGTDLTFEARRWIPLDFEICTAPVEESVNGVIVADGALFFRKIGEKLTLVIRDGKLVSLAAQTPDGEALAQEYRRMTERDMARPGSRQLAEIGIGFCAGALISDCFMEAEAAENTCHFCFGNNVCYGGENAGDFHGASVLIRSPVWTCEA